MGKQNNYSDILKKGTYSLFYLNVVNYNFSSDIYKEDLINLENKYIKDSLKKSIESLKLKMQSDKTNFNVRDELVKICENLIKNVDLDFVSTLNSLSSLKFNFSDIDNFSFQWEISLVRHILFSELKKKVNSDNYKSYIMSLKNLEKNKIIGNFTYTDAEDYIRCIVLNKITLDDIKSNGLEKYKDIKNFDFFLRDLFKYIFSKETNKLTIFNENSKKKIYDILDHFPDNEEYKNSVEILFYYLSKDQFVTYNREGYFILPNDVISGGNFKYTNIKTIEDLEKYKKNLNMTFPLIKNFEKKEKFENIIKFFEYNEKVKHFKRYFDYYDEIMAEYKTVMNGDFNSSFNLTKTKNDGTFASLKGNMVKSYNGNNNIYNILDETYNNLKNVKINIKQDKSNEVSTYENILYSVREKITSNEKLISFESTMENSHSSVEKKINEFPNNIKTLKNKIKELTKINNVIDNKVDLKKYTDEYFDKLLYKDLKNCEKSINLSEESIKNNFDNQKASLKAKYDEIIKLNGNKMELDGKNYNITIDPKYNTENFFNDLTVDNFTTIKNEIQNLENKVNKNVIDYNDSLNKKIAAEKAAADEETKKKIKEAEDKKKIIEGEIKQVCNEYLTSIENLTIFENFDKNTISTGLDQKINELYSNKGYNVDDLTGWKSVNDKLSVTIQQLKSECVNKCNEEIDKKLKEIADKKAKDLEEQQKKTKEEEDKKAKEEQDNNKDEKKEEEKHQQGINTYTPEHKNEKGFSCKGGKPSCKK